MFKSIPARHKSHINVLEADAYVLWLRWLLHNRRHHSSKRVVCLLDSKVVLGATSKGRTSAPGLRHAVRQAAALTLAEGLLVREIYVPTDCNPADAGSRGKRGLAHIFARQGRHPGSSSSCTHAPNWLASTLARTHKMVRDLANCLLHACLVLRQSTHLSHAVSCSFEILLV